MDGAVNSIGALERAKGKLSLSVKRRAGATVLDTFFQDGCLKARFPKMHHPGVKRGVLINTSGGIADGDLLETSVVVADGASLALTSQAAERFYRARNPADPARLITRMTVNADAGLMWMPQETILFDGVAARRSFDVDIARTGRFMGMEMLVIGRTAMRERVKHCNLFDRWRIRLDDKLIYADGLRLEGLLDRTARGSALLGRSIAVASLFYVGKNAADLADPLRRIFDQNPSVLAGCSVRGDLLITRCAACDSAELRHLIAAALTAADRHMNETTSVTQAILPRWIH